MMGTATLALPQLGVAPAQLAVNPGDALAAKAALALHEAGRFDPGALHPARPFPGALALIRGAFQRWLLGVQAQFDDARFSLAVGVGAGSAINEDFLPVSADKAAQRFEIVLGNHGGTPFQSCWILKRRYESVERAVRGLAGTALFWIGRAGGYGLPLWTPWRALDGAMWAYWAGCDDEREYLEQMVGEGEETDHLDMFTRAQFDAAIPAHIAAPRELLRRPALERLARSRVKKTAARIAQLCLEIRAECRRDDKDDEWQGFIPDREHEVVHLHHLAAVRWTNDDPSLRIFDDWANPAYETGEAIEAYGWHEVPVEPASLKAWFAGMERTFRIAALGQQLLALIAEQSP